MALMVIPPSELPHANHQCSSWKILLGFPIYRPSVWLTALTLTHTLDVFNWISRLITTSLKWITLIEKRRKQYLYCRIRVHFIWFQGQNLHAYVFLHFLAVTKQFYQWFSPSVCPPICLSICPTVCLSHLVYYVPIILSSWNFRSDYHRQKWCLCKMSRSKVKVTEV